MIARRYETIVGIFVVASVVALLIMVLIIARQEGIFQEYVHYRAIFRNVSGLKPGSEVRLAGVTVGNVKDTTINPNGTIVVTFKVMRRYSDQIRWDSQASIGLMGLLGEKSLDLTAGSLEKPPVPPEGFVAASEPLDITQLLARAGPSLEDVQKVLTNLVALTSKMTEPGSEFGKTMNQVSQIVNKINQGKGTIGLLINDPALYKEATESVAAVRKFTSDLEQAKGLMGTLLNDEAFKSQAQKTLAHLEATFANLSKATGDLKEAVGRAPGMAKRLDAFLINLNRAGKGLPGLVTSGETFLSDADQTSKAAQQSWFLRKYVPKPEEHTIRMDGAAGKD
jgi:phospholipid/cholesterol/gamma-HCH transport system substrate-binding protein